MNVPVPDGVHRLTVDFPDETFKALKKRAVSEGLSATGLIKALAQMFVEDAAVADRAVELGEQQRRAGLVRNSSSR